MMKASLLALGMVVGSVLAVVGFLAIGYLFRPQFVVDEPGVWTWYSSVIFAGVGAVGGSVMGRAACDWINKPRMHVPASSEIPPANAAVQPHRNTRPLRWLHRA